MGKVSKCKTAFGYVYIVNCFKNVCIEYSSSYNLTISFTIHVTDDCQCVIPQKINIFVSLIIFSIVHSLINKYKYNILINKFKNSFSEKKFPLIENLRIKSSTCFNHQFNIIFVILSWGSFFH